MLTEGIANMGVTYPKGFKATGVKAGIKKSGNLDLAIIYSESDAVVAGTFTTNAVAAAPVKVSKKVVERGRARAIVANAGCANACTGLQGYEAAVNTQKIVGETLGCLSDDIIIASTGIIGVQLPMDKMEFGIKQAVSQLSTKGSQLAGDAIITTDTYAKIGTTAITIDDQEVRLGVIAKGSGMIQPNMATMLCFITTDINITQALLQEALSEVVDLSFNMISIDGDMSTNDMVIILANGAAKNRCIDTKSDGYTVFKMALLELCQNISRSIAADGEGATKFLTINVLGCQSFQDAKTVGMTVAKSPLVKTAFFGEDPNWGRIICAVGYSGVLMDADNVVVKFGDIPVYQHGVGTNYDEQLLRDVMHAHDIIIDIDLGQGEHSATVWTCDFSYEYVKINGEYHT